MDDVLLCPVSTLPGASRQCLSSSTRMHPQIPDWESALTSSAAPLLSCFSLLTLVVGCLSKVRWHKVRRNWLRGHLLAPEGDCHHLCGRFQAEVLVLFNKSGFFFGGEGGISQGRKERVVQNQKQTVCSFTCMKIHQCFAYSGKHVSAAWNPGYIYQMIFRK